MRAYFIYILLANVLVSSLACSGEKEPDPSQEAYELEIPSHFPSLHIPEDNPMTRTGVALGRKLYYDKMLSKDGDRSCSSCHQQSVGFTLPGSNVLPHVNLAWNNHFLWKGEVQGSLEDAMIFEVKDFFETDLEKFNQNAEYLALFKESYQITSITHKDLAYALSQFFRTMISANSPFDKFYKKQYVLSSEESHGMELFFSEKGDCFHCHGSVLLTNNDFHNIGLEAAPMGAHLGLFEVTGNPSDKGKFKTPTLRNVAIRNSFMHDGRFTTLEEVIEHYNSGVQLSPTLDPLMYKHKSIKLNLSDEEKAALVAFLKTFTDQDFLSNPEFGDPNK